MIIEYAYIRSTRNKEQDSKTEVRSIIGKAGAYTTERRKAERME